VACLAPRVPGEMVGPRRLSGVVVRPLNFTVRPTGNYPSCISMPVTRSTFTRRTLAERLAAYERLRATQTKVEYGAFFCVFLLLLATAAVVPALTLTRGERIALVIGILVLFIGLALVGSGNVPRAQKASGLLCPACGHQLNQVDLLHVVLSGKCKHCKSNIYRDDGQSA
jgi:hypothetical protein